MTELWLFLLSLAMFAGSYLAGCLPLFFSLSERRIRLFGIFGAGLLVGTALCVIIPEGVNTLLEAAPPGGNGAPRDTLLPHQNALAYLAGADDAGHGNNSSSGQINVPPKNGHEQIKDEFKEAPKTLKEELPNKNGKWLGKSHVVKREALDPKNPTLFVAGSERANKHVENKELTVNKRSNSNTDEKPGEEKGGGEKLNTTVMGVSLVVGFIFMFLIDQFSKRLSRSSRNNLPTLGLVIHAAADGLAMGSASSSSSEGQTEMQMLVFFAIMLHKAPAAFALASCLMMEGLERSRVRKHLLVFSLSAPVATIVTYFLLVNIRLDGDASWWTGLILLFSGGTFLYIATVHVLPELFSDHHCEMLEPLMPPGHHHHHNQETQTTNSNTSRNPAAFPNYSSCPHFHQHHGEHRREEEGGTVGLSEQPTQQQPQQQTAAPNSIPVVASSTSSSVVSGLSADDAGLLSTAGSNVGQQGMGRRGSLHHHHGGGLSFSEISLFCVAALLPAALSLLGGGD